MANTTVHNDKGAKLGDSLNAVTSTAFTNQLTDIQRCSIANAVSDAYNALGGNNANVGKTVFASYTLSSTSLLLYVSAA